MLTWDEKKQYASFKRFDKDHDRELGHNLQRARERVGLSQEDVGEIIGLSYRSIQRMEYGETSARQYLTDFCQIYSCTYDDLIPQDFRPLLNGKNDLLSRMDSEVLQSIKDMFGNELDRRKHAATLQ